MQHISDRDYFDQLKLAFDIFGTYRESIVDFNIYPVPSSFYNGAPAHSNSCCICIELSQPISGEGNIGTSLKKWGWSRFEDGRVWELRV